MKKIAFTFTMCLAAVCARAQIGYNYHYFDIGGGLTYNQVFPDYPKTDKNIGYLANLAYKTTPFVSFIGELQKSNAAGSGAQLAPGFVYSFTNSYYSGALRAQVQAGELMDYSRSRFKNFLKNIYLSAGFGVLHSNLSVLENGAPYYTRQYHYYFIPLKAGYEAKIFNGYTEPLVKIDVGYQFNYMLTDDFDGLKTVDSKYNDAIGQFVLSVKIPFGGVTSYRKAINY